MRVPGQRPDVIRNLAHNVQAFTSNVFLVDGDRTVLVDVGNEFDVVSAVTEAAGDLDAVVLTHTHPDHVGNLSDVVETFEVDVWGYDTADERLDHELGDGETVRLGNHEYLALHTPGHKDDHLCLYAESPGVLFAGDLVFAGGSFGRTDLDEGDRDRLVGSIDYVLETVAEDLAELHAGHGPSVTDEPYRDIQMAWQAARL